MDKNEIYQKIQEGIKKKYSKEIPQIKEGLLVREEKADYIVKIIKKKK